MQIGVLEIHDWGVSLDHLTEPDRLVLDLDPDEGLPLAELKAAAVEIRDFLAELGFTSFLKSTGGKGLHVVAPLTPKLGWEEIKTFAKGVADALVEVRGDRYTANPLKRTARAKSLSTICATTAAARQSSPTRPARAGRDGCLPAALG